MEYVSSPSSSGNVFLDAVESTNDRKSLILHRGKLCFVIMNLYPYNNGHLMIVPYRKVDSMVKLSKEEIQEIMHVSKISMKIISIIFFLLPSYQIFSTKVFVLGIVILFDF